MSNRLRRAGGALAIASIAAAVTVISTTGPAWAWDPPTARGEGGGCVGGNRDDVLWTIRQNELGFPDNPGRLRDVVTDPAFPLTVDTYDLPTGLDGDGNKHTATVTSTVPAGFDGWVTLRFGMDWVGVGETAKGETVVHLSPCSTTTTTTVAVQGRVAARSAVPASTTTTTTVAKGPVVRPLPWWARMIYWLFAIQPRRVI